MVLTMVKTGIPAGSAGTTQQPSHNCGSAPTNNKATVSSATGQSKKLTRAQSA